MNGPDPLKALKLAQENAKKSGNPDQQDCQNCTRQGLAILPVRFAALPDVLGATLPAGMKVQGPALDAKHASYGLRTLRQGYLYVYIDGKNAKGQVEKRWDVYAVTQEGILRGPFAPAAALGQTAPWTCGRSDGGSHAAKASFITIPNANDVSAAYFVFSQDGLSEEARSELAANTSRMRHIDVQAWLKGPLPADTGAFGVDQLHTHVLEYMAKPLGADKAPLQTAWRSRQKEAADTPVLMTNAMKGKYAGRAMVLALHDRIGIVQELASARGVYEFKMTELGGQHARKMFVASATENLRLDFEKRGKTKEWNDTYAKAYKKSEVDKFSVEYMKLYKPIEAKRNAYALMWADWMGDGHLTSMINSLNNRYHKDSPIDAINQARTIADLLNGTGKTQAEVKVWTKWLGETGTNKDNLLDRAVSGGSASMLAFLGSRKDGFPGVVDTFKNMYTAFDEWEKANAKLADHIREASRGMGTPGVDPREWAVRRGEPLLEGMQKFYQTMAGNVGNMAGASAKHVRNTLLAGALWMNVKFTPIRVNQTASQLALDLKDTAWADLPGKKLFVVESTPKTQTYRVNTTEFMDIVAVDTRRVTYIAYEVGMVRNESGLWVPGGNRTPAGIVLPSNVPPTAATPPRVNYFLQAKKVAVSGIKGGGAATGFAGIVLFLQYKSFMDALETLHNDTATDIAKQDALKGAVSAGIGAIGAMAEGSAGVWQLAKGGAQTMAMGRLAALGGALGAVASLVQSVQVLVQGLTKSDQGDKDAANFLYAASFFFAVGGVAAGAGALASAGVTIAALSAIGPVGWALIAIGAIVLGVAAMFGASWAADDPLEAWLKQSLYGIASDKFKEDDETAAFNKIFELPLDVKLNYDTQWLSAKHCIQLMVSMPKLAGRAQQFEVNLVVNTADGKGARTSTVRGSISTTESAHPVLAKNQTAQQLKVLDAEEQELVRQRRLWLNDWKLDSQDGKYVVERKIEFNDVFTNGVGKPFVTSATLAVKYWPDFAKNPELFLPIGGGPGGAPAKVLVPV
jgi:hypothetical protein